MYQVPSAEFLSNAEVTETQAWLPALFIWGNGSYSRDCHSHGDSCLATASSQWLFPKMATNWPSAQPKSTSRPQAEHLYSQNWRCKKLQNSSIAECGHNATSEDSPVVTWWAGVKAPVSWVTADIVTLTCPELPPEILESLPTDIRMYGK